MSAITCGCSHDQLDHIEGKEWCRNPGCQCEKFHPQKTVPQLEAELEKLKTDQEYEILGIMLPVDKWLTNEQAEKYKDNPAHRSAIAREIALRAIEDNYTLAFNEGLKRGAEAALEKWMNMEYSNTKEEQIEEAEKLTKPFVMKALERNEL